jgi:hypothetical protein
MISRADSIEKRLQIAGTLLIIGLVIEALCLIWGQPISFVIFVAVGGLFMFAGVVLFLFSLVSIPQARD